MSKSFFTHFLSIILIHGLLFLGTWQVIKSEEFSALLPKLENGIIHLKVSSQILLPQKRTAIPKSSTQVAQKSKAPLVPVTSSEVNDSAQDQSFKVAAIDLYKAELRTIIDKNKYYPTMSRRLGQTGTVVIAFTLLADGNIVDIRIDKPSQYERLNISAMDAVKKVERFKPIPKEIGEARMDIKVPVKFFTI